jgi:hypothetical protein
MKKAIFSTIMFAAVTVSVMASGTKKLSVPGLVKGELHTDFGNIQNVTWSIYKQYYKATFTERNRQYEAFYTADGDLVGDTYDIAFSRLPERAQRYIQKKYSDYKIGETMQYTDAQPDDDIYIFGSPFDDTAYLVTLEKDNRQKVLEVSCEGDVSEFHEPEKK